MANSPKMICPFGHSTRGKHSLCPVCGEHLIDERRKEDCEVEHERRKEHPEDSS